MGLTREQIEAYNENGFVVAKGVLDTSDTQPVIDELVEFIDHRARDCLLYTSPSPRDS